MENTSGSPTTGTGLVEDPGLGITKALEEIASKLGLRREATSGEVFSKAEQVLKDSHDDRTNPDNWSHRVKHGRSTAPDSHSL